MPDLTIAFTVLITGFTVVFAVLILLIFIIKIYGTIVFNAQQKSKQKKDAALAAKKAAEEQEKAQQAPKVQVDSTPVSEGISPQIIAVIAAAVDAMYGEGNVKVKTIKRLPQSRPVWSTAGLMDNTRPF
ncbi:MAG TPA: sodium pump decarboxylase [Clostridiales bacterium]|nr:sodium pump decarboxylase [Clostridiales bacterium]